jgi:hypothetical protein
LNEKFGIGWSFWTFKEPESTSTVVSVPLPAGWDEIAAVGSAASPDAAPPVAPARAASVVAAYLQNVRFAHGHVNAGYVRSLGLSLPPVVARAAIPVQARKS